MPLYEYVLLVGLLGTPSTYIDIIACKGASSCFVYLNGTATKMLGFKQRRDRSVVTRYRWLADFFWDRKITRAGDGINIVSGTDELEGSTFREDANSNAT